MQAFLCWELLHIPKFCRQLLKNLKTSQQNSAKLKIITRYYILSINHLINNCLKNNGISKITFSKLLFI
jgi:hypothetical protein